MIYPSALRCGSKVAITAFSSGVPSHLHPRLDIVINHLRAQGFDVIEGKCLRQNHQHVSATAQERATELMDFLCDDSIDAVIPPWGGEFAMDILPLLDFTRLKQVRAKWLFGFSDVSTILIALSSKLGWASVHCANLMNLHPNEQEPLTANTMHWLSLQPGASFTQNSSEFYQVDGSGFVSDPNFVFNLTERTCWKLSGNQKTTFSGRLIGGCFDTMMHLVGTEFFDIDQWYHQYASDGLILYLENVEMAPSVYKRALQSLKYKRVFDKCSGLLIGRSAVLDSCGKEISTEQALLAVTDSLNIPVVYDVDIGHLPPNLTLFNGAYAEVNVSTEGGELIQTLN
ncbi:S66 family peptidase [Celerinatantimonas diazotrophica]|uniref:Muramoyltetrapeptide carboxypeptidase LdcA involved in peptidoglycan recycling n=1 Tax=Celerinatantimonas diazotrophica TaxID=412034 RepID=A0A4R1J965_9GAMM|nr:S66 peptidase family protein [Celerinatantimonas diazotrophica]TCK46934.1 muramoyltetrapeptide carboxypeptidase LdcA involved in peptidoglycan recycling [Celerinatantimonas diazotrophica]CAG9295702.1 Microcin C7 self-immunity protein MccF [Celerinatantimonas diazotrophica]